MDQGNVDVAMIKVRDRITGYDISFASMHVPGVSFQRLEAEKQKGIAANQDQQAWQGDQHCEFAANLLTAADAPSFAFVGADINVPYGQQNQAGQRNPCFEKFTDRNFEVLTPQGMPNINPLPDEPDGTHTFDIQRPFLRLSQYGSA